jgi:hypothetical protein
MTTEAPEKAYFFCNSCRRDTNHELKGEHRSVHTSENEFTEVVAYRFWICMGCEHGLLQRTYTNDFMQDDDEEYDFFPPSSREALFPKTFAKLKPHLQAIYKEAIVCYNQEALILSAAGLRALMEGLCQDKRIRGRNLKEKINGLNRLLPNKAIVRDLHQFRFMGNEAVHELSAPKAFAIKLAIEIIEDLLNFFYALDHKANNLRRLRKALKVKPRPAKVDTISKPNII